MNRFENDLSRSTEYLFQLVNLVCRPQFLEQRLALFGRAPQEQLLDRREIWFSHSQHPLVYRLDAPQTREPLRDERIFAPPRQASLIVHWRQAWLLPVLTHHEGVQPQLERPIRTA